MKTDTKDKIVAFIANHDRTRAYDLVRAINISQVAIHKHLKDLIFKGKIKKVGKPPFVFYSITQKSTSGDKSLDQATKNKIIVVLKSHGAIRASLFGSYARNEARVDSDIDILVELPREQSLLDFVDLKLSLEETIGKKVDLVEYTAIKPRIKDYIVQDQIQIL